MNARIAAALLVLAAVPSVSFAAQAPPPAPILKLSNAVVGAANQNDATALSGLFTADATVVDENAPFVWRGAGAGMAWWHVVVAVSQKAKLTHMKASNLRIGEYRQSPTDAYLVQPMTIAGLAAGKPFAESGTMTYTFHQSGGHWLISTTVWTTKP